MNSLTLSILLGNTKLLLMLNSRNRTIRQFMTGGNLPINFLPETVCPGQMPSRGGAHSFWSALCLPQYGAQGSLRHSGDWLRSACQRPSARSLLSRLRTRNCIHGHLAHMLSSIRVAAVELLKERHQAKRVTSLERRLWRRPYRSKWKAPRQEGVLGTGDIRAVVGRAVHIQVSVSHARAPGVVEKGYSDIMGPAAPIALNQKLVRMTRSGAREPSGRR
jgi:hypothetical protein